MSDVKTRARLSILSTILAYPRITAKDWQSSYTPPLGSLVSLSSAPTSKWYLSWVIDVDTKHSFNKYLLESVEDGELCDWTNVSLNIYNPEKVASNPQWRWTDKQFELRDRWKRVLKKNDSYWVRYNNFIFDNEKLIISLRSHIFCQDNFIYEKTFPNWKKVTIKMLDNFYKDGVFKYNTFKESS